MGVNTPRFDVLGLGCTAVDDLLYVPRFPGVDKKIQVQRSARRFGGLTGVALMAAARLGARCAYAGCLGNDALSEYAAAYLAREGVDVSLAPRLPDAAVVHSTVVVGTDSGSRNIFFQGSGMIGAHDTKPPEEVIKAFRVLFIDQWGMTGNLRACRIARSSGVAVIADIEDARSPLFRDVLDLVDHLIVAEGFAKEITGEPDAPSAVRRLWRDDRAAVIVTCGAKGCWSVSSESSSGPVRFPAFEVKPTDTTGCGDVFHGAYAASLARGDKIETRIRFASAAAALRARDGETPRQAALQNFLAAHPKPATPKRPA